MPAAGLGAWVAAEGADPTPRFPTAPRSQSEEPAGRWTVGMAAWPRLGLQGPVYSNSRKPTPSSTCRNGKPDALEDASAGLRRGLAPWGRSTWRRPNPQTGQDLLGLPHGSLEHGDWDPPSLTSKGRCVLSWEGLGPGLRRSRTDGRGSSAMKLARAFLPCVSWKAWSPRPRLSHGVRLSSLGLPATGHHGPWTQWRSPCLLWRGGEPP